MVQATDGGNTSDSPDEEDYTGNEIYLFHIIYKKAWSLSFSTFIITYTECFTFIWNFHIWTNLVIFHF